MQQNYTLHVKYPLLSISRQKQLICNFFNIFLFSLFPCKIGFEPYKTDYKILLCLCSTAMERCELAVEPR